MRVCWVSRLVYRFLKGLIYYLMLLYFRLCFYNLKNGFFYMDKSVKNRLMNLGLIEIKWPEIIKYEDYKYR
jgi:hypothetical protein